MCIFPHFLAEMCSRVGEGRAVTGWNRSIQLDLSDKVHLSKDLGGKGGYLGEEVSGRGPASAEAPSEECAGLLKKKQGGLAACILSPQQNV